MSDKKNSFKTSSFRHLLFDEELENVRVGDLKQHEEEEARHPPPFSSKKRIVKLETLFLELLDYTTHIKPDLFDILLTFCWDFC